MALGISCRYLLAYSPDLRQMALGHLRENPIEQAWSKPKTHLRAKAARTRDALGRAISEALAAVTSSNAQGWFRHAGYPLHRAEVGSRSPASAAGSPASPWCSATTG